MTYSDAQRLEALALLATVGKAEAARRTGIPAGTIASWGSRSGTKAPPAAATVVATEARVATIAQRKATLAEGLMDDIERMRRDLFAPTIERKVVPGNQYRRTRIIDVRNPTTTHGDRRTVVEAVAKAIETVQLLTGGATARTEMLTAKQAAIEEARVRGSHLRAV